MVTAIGNHKQQRGSKPACTMPTHHATDMQLFTLLSFSNSYICNVNRTSSGKVNANGQ